MAEDAARAEMPGFEAWLSASWSDFVRRWWAMAAAGGAGAAASLLAAVLPFVPAPFLQLAGVSPWVAWGAPAAVALLGLLWFSAWAQAAVIRAAVADEPFGETLSRSWAQALPLAWTLSLMLIVTGGGLFLLILPGLFLFGLFALAPVIEVSGEARGWAALERSAGRVLAAPGAAFARLTAAALVCALPSWIPWVGWLAAPLMAPFWVCATARLDADLRAARPDAAAPKGLAPVAAGLVVVFLFGAVAAGWGAWKAALALRELVLSGGLSPEDAAKAMDLLRGAGVAP